MQCQLQCEALPCLTPHYKDNSFTKTSHMGYKIDEGYSTFPPVEGWQYTEVWTKYSFINSEGEAHKEFWQLAFFFPSQNPPRQQCYLPWYTIENNSCKSNKVCAAKAISVSDLLNIVCSPPLPPWVRHHPPPPPQCKCCCSLSPPPLPSFRSFHFEVVSQLCEIWD